MSNILVNTKVHGVTYQKTVTLTIFVAKQFLPHDVLLFYLWSCYLYPLTGLDNPSRSLVLAAVSAIALQPRTSFSLVCKSLIEIYRIFGEDTSLCYVAIK
jgi:hypothetical protein